MVRAIASACFIACCGLVAKAASPQQRLATYQSEIANNESGVYELDGDLYAHVRMTVEKSDQPQICKAKAFCTAKKLLKKWAFDCSSASRNKDGNLTKGWQLAVSTLDSMDATWRFENWKMKISGQEVSGKTGNILWFGLIVAKDEVVKQIPPSFSKSCPTKEEIEDGLQRLIPIMLASISGKSCVVCGIFDLMPRLSSENMARKECDSVDKKLKEYHKSAPLIMGFAFLSSKEKEVYERAQTPLGKRAASAYFDTISSLDQKETLLREALCENPVDGQLWNMFGHCRMKHDDLLGAVLCFRMAQKIKPKDPFAWTNLAIAYDVLNCPCTACGMAVVAIGLCSDSWCREKAAGILSKY